MPILNDVWTILNSNFFTTLLEVGVIAWVTIKAQHLAEKLTEKRRIQGLFEKLIELCIANPVVESEGMRSGFDKKSGDDPDRLLYESYCCQVWNALVSIYRFEEAYPKEPKSFNAAELVRLHKRWIRMDAENKDALKGPFGDWLLDQLRDTNQEECKKA